MSQEIPPPLLPPPQALKSIQNPDFCLDPTELHHLAHQKTELDLCRLNQKTLDQSYQLCLEKDHGALQFWQTPTGVILISLIGVIGGISLDRFLRK